MEFDMPKKLRDVVYVLRPDIDPEELRYSLRSVEKNFPHRKVWFVGGQPDGIEPDIMLNHKQTGASKWELIRSSMFKVVQEPDLTDEFFLFNDDFFVMKPFKGKFVNFVDKTLEWRVEDLRKIHPWLNPYGRTLYKANEELKSLGIKDPMNFEVHMPMLFKKDLVISSILKCSSPQMRSIYGNVTNCEWVQHDDVKVYDLESTPDWDFLSTNDNTFRDGKVGEMIRGVFSNPSRWETPTPKGV